MSNGINPYNNEEAKVDQIRRMFNNIASKYDLLNQLISFGQCNKWRRELIKILATFGPVRILDIATGTADLAIDMVRDIPSIKLINGIDISEEMMRVGADKITKLNYQSIINLQKDDAIALSFEDNTFDAVTIAFGIRNFPDIPKSISEAYRVLKPGKPFIFLELTEPQNKLILFGYKIYTSSLMPLLGKIISGDSKAYKYLPKSIQSVPQREEMVDLLNKAGFDDTFYRSLRMGTCTIYMGIKKDGFCSDR